MPAGRSLTRSLGGSVALCGGNSWGCGWHHCSAGPWDIWGPGTGLISSRGAGRGEASAWLVQITAVTWTAPAQPAQPLSRTRPKPVQSLPRAPLGREQGRAACTESKGAPARCLSSPLAAKFEGQESSRGQATWRSLLGETEPPGEGRGLSGEPMVFSA